MDNYNNIINNDYNSMVYGNETQQQHPMTSIPREIQISHEASIQQHPAVTNQQSDIINLSYNQRDMQMQPHPNLPEQMGLFPTMPPQNQQHNHVIQQESLEQTSTQENVNIQYNIESENATYSEENLKDTQVQQQSPQQNAGDEAEKSEQISTVVNDVEQSQATNEDEQSNDDNKVEGDEEEEGKKKEPDVDPNQCRVCKATESLIDIFAIEEDMRICDIITKMCSGIRIHERDFLPHMICLSCLGRLRVAYQFMKDVIATDTELRGKLKRSKKARKPTDGVIIIDCNEFTDSEYEEQNDDDDFQISNAEEEEDDDDFDSVDSDDSRKPKVPKKRGPKPKRNKVKRMKKELASTAKRLKRDIVFIEADSDDEERKKERCKECSKVFSNKQALRMHKQKAHTKPSSETPFRCNICGKGFKYSINLSSHMQIHKDSYTCDECGRVFVMKSEAKKHALNQHKCSLSYECNKCRRLYCSVRRYQKHRESCSDYSSSSKKKPMKVSKEDLSFTGRDLFKTVAPTTTTYWSDSFSD